MNSLIEVLNWRYATKKMDPNRVVPQEKLDRILEAIRLAPTNYIEAQNWLKMTGRNTGLA